MAAVVTSCSFCNSGWLLRGQMNTISISIYPKETNTPHPYRHIPHIPTHTHTAHIPTYTHTTPHTPLHTPTPLHPLPPTHTTINKWISYPQRLANQIFAYGLLFRILSCILCSCWIVFSALWEVRKKAEAARKEREIRENGNVSLIMLHKTLDVASYHFESKCDIKMLLRFPEKAGLENYWHICC